MIVKELIEYLENVPSDLTVITLDGWTEEFKPIAIPRIVVIGETEDGLLDLFDDKDNKLIEERYPVNYGGLVIS